MSSTPDHRPDQRSANPLAPALANAERSHVEARQHSLELQNDHKALSRHLLVLAVHAPDENSRYALRLRLAKTGISLAQSRKEQFRLERDLVTLRRSANTITPLLATACLSDIRRQYLSVGTTLWHYQQSKSLLTPSPVLVIDPRHGSPTACLMALYSDPLPPSPQPPSFREDALRAYARRTDWCHVTGPSPSHSISAVPIVPLDVGSSFSEILFGANTPSLLSAGNALLLSPCVATWFNTHHLVIVPAHPITTPVTVWRVDVLSPSIVSAHPSGRDLDGQLLQFQTPSRPLTQFLLFRFLAALVMIRADARPGWEAVWARYAAWPPFPWGAWMKKEMVSALATHFGPMEEAGWMTGYGFGDETGLRLDAEQAVEAARRVLCFVEGVVDGVEGGVEEEEEEGGVKEEEGGLDPAVKEEEDGEGSQIPRSPSPIPPGMSPKRTRDDGDDGDGGERTKKRRHGGPKTLPCGGPRRRKDTPPSL